MATHDRFDCPPALDLLDYSAGAVPEPAAAAIAEHVQQCATCADLVENLRVAGRDPAKGQAGTAAPSAVPEGLRRASAEPARRFRALLPQSAPPQTRFGQLWTTGASPDAQPAGGLDWAGTPRAVALLGAEATSVDGDHPSLIVAPISLDIEYQSDRDLLVPAEKNPLGHPFMIEAWNEVTMLKAQLGRYLAELRQPFKRYLGLLYQAQLGADVDLGPLQDYLGPAISSEDDPRFAFQEDESEACEYLRRPLLQALAVAEAEPIPEAALAPAPSRTGRLQRVAGQAARHVIDFPDRLLEWLRLPPAGPMRQPAFAYRGPAGPAEEAQHTRPPRERCEISLADAEGSERLLDLSLEPQPGVLHVRAMWKDSWKPAAGLGVEVLSGDMSLGEWTLGPDGEADLVIQPSPDLLDLRLAVTDNSEL